MAIRRVVVLLGAVGLLLAPALSWADAALGCAGWACYAPLDATAGRDFSGWSAAPWLSALLALTALVAAVSRRPSTALGLAAAALGAVSIVTALSGLGLSGDLVAVDAGGPGSTLAVAGCLLVAAAQVRRSASAPGGRRRGIALKR